MTPSSSTGQAAGSGPPADKAGTFAASLLRSGSRAIAAHAAELLLERDPQAEKLFGSRSFRGWQDNLAQRIEELAAAAEIGSSSMFCRDIGWSVAAFAARSVPTGPVAGSLEALRDAISADLPIEAAALTTTLLDEGIEAAQRPQPAITRLSPDQPLGGLALEYMKLVLEGDRRGAIGVLVGELESGRPLADLYERVLLAVESEIGTMWHLGEVSVPEEHAATETMRSAMAVLCYAAPREPARPGTILISAVEGDRHDIGVRAVADLIEVAGYRSVGLGGDVPVRDIVRACQDFEATVLMLSATMTVHLPAVSRAIRAVRDADLGTPIRFIVGGEAFSADPSLFERVGADGYAASPSHAVAILNDSLSNG